MQGFFARLLFALLALSGPVSAQDIVLGMSKTKSASLRFSMGRKS